MALTYRSEKGSALTFDEMDNNFRALTGSQTISGTLTVTEGARITGSVTISGSNTFTNIGSFSQTGDATFTGDTNGEYAVSINRFGADNLALSVSGSSRFSGSKAGSQTVDVNGGISASNLTLDKDIQSAAALDAGHYIINGKRGEIRSQLQEALSIAEGFTLELRNTSIASNSIIVANLIGGYGGLVTGSLVTANVIAAGSASVCVLNPFAPVADNNVFTASFAIF